jgi:hypothetical protein
VHFVAKYFLPATQLAQKILAHFSGLSGLGYTKAINAGA